ncbi:MAG: LacI family DNA-binding transcriptional regulator [Tsuneonella sp.]
MTDLRQRRARVTSVDVAEAAGVSQSTVSRALSGSPTITEQTRTRVERAARELGYFVDERAARLRSGRTGTVAIVVIGREGQHPTRVSAFHYALLGSTCAAVAEQGYQALVSFQSEAEQFFWHFAAQGQADGLIVMGTSVNRAAWRDLRHCAPEGPCVTWGAPYDAGRWVRADNRAGARLATERMIAAGHRRIGFAGTVDAVHPQFTERYAGYRDALAAAGLPVFEPVTAPGDDRVEQGSAAITDLLGRAEPADAVFAANDMIALGALDALAARGVQVPRDFAVVGFDGLAAGVHSNPPLTTIEPDFAEAGRALVRGVFDGGQTGGERVPVTLIERGSVRPAS